MVVLISPFLVCDPQAGITHYHVVGLGDNATVSAQADGSIRMDLGKIAPGSYSIEVRACREPWGCSDPAPFEFTKPLLSAPAGIRFGK